MIMSKKSYIVWFNEVGKDDVGLVGGKGANLGVMTEAGFPIPFGFIVTSKAYFEIIKELPRILKERKKENIKGFKEFMKRSNEDPILKGFFIRLIKFLFFPYFVLKNVLKGRES